MIRYRERLEAAIGQSSVYRTASSYRSAVDEALFGLGTRYGSLIDLLLQLRKPQIMRDFKADDLSQLFSEALPPLSPRLIENVSVSFRSLESDRQQLAELTEVRKSVDIFLKSYSHYVRVAVRRRAADVRRAHSQFETAQREIKRLADESEKNEMALVSAEAEEQRVEEALAAAHQTERTLLVSPEMKSAEDLRHAKETRDDRAKRVEESEAMLLESHAVRDQRSKERKEAEASVARESEAVSERHAALTEVWQEAGLPNLGLPSPDAADAGPRKVFDQTIVHRAKAIEVVREKNLELEKCVARRKEEEIRILACIGTGENEGETWLTPDGRWQHGLLRGAWRKPAAEYLGHNAREEARRRRMAEMEAVLLTIDESIAILARERKAIEIRVVRIVRERASAPSVAQLQRAAHELESAEIASGEARQRLDEIDQLLSKAVEAERDARDTRDRDAADLGLTRWKESSALAKLELILADVRVKAARLWPAWDALVGARYALGKASAVR